jgi:polysaccharide deacetylase family protein (PEP-CTERM system associated)
MKNNIFLFSVDLEDVRENVVDGHKYKDRVIENTRLFLHWLEEHKFNCTFFTVGKIGEKYPELIKEIVAKGHEIACHSYDHTPIDKQGKENFRADLDKNIAALLRAGAGEIKGFRAPVFSLTKNSEWAHSILKEAGITYSSSVLPAKNPLYGWENFGENYKKLDNGLIEIPMTVGSFGPMRVPIAGGVYFRVLPRFFVFSAIKNRLAQGQPVLSYFHPYDIDTKQEHFMHAGINNSKFYNWLMYYNRKNVFTRLNKILELDLHIITYKEFASKL